MNIAVGVVVVALLVVFALSLAAGYFWGRHQATARLRELVEVRRNSFRLGQLVPDEPARRQLAKAYYDPEAAFRELDHYCWDAPNVIPTPFVGYMPAPEHQNRFTTNARQFRAPREVESPKSDRTYRIFLLGGSTAFGSGAPDQSRTIGGYLERMVVDQLINQTGQRCELFTAAVPAWASTHERIAVEDLVSGLEPDLVLTLSGCNDAHW